MVKVDEYTFIVKISPRALHAGIIALYSHFQGSPDIHTWIRHNQNWIERSAGYVSATALILSQNGLKNDLRGSQNLPGEHAPRPLVLFAYACCIHAHQTSM